MATIGPTLEGAPSLYSVAFDLGSVGYVTTEHLATGVAAAYAGADTGVVRRQETAEFATRLVVHQPIDPARANGTVIVEWLNVTGGLDVPAVWMAAHRHLVRDGYTWAGVSAQQVGIEGGGVLPGLGLRQTHPDRYGSLVHPGDAYAFDIFAQAGAAVRSFLQGRDRAPVDRMIATGASQSAFYLTTYVNAIDPLDAVFDAFLLQGRAGRGAPIEGWEPGAINPGAAPDPAARRARLTGRDHIRRDARVPVLVVQSETDVFGALGYLPARQPDSDRFRLWEVAGAAHCDSYFLSASPRDSGSLGAEELADLIERGEAAGMSTDVPINTGPQMHYVLQRAVDALDRWTRNGVAPPAADRLGVDGHDDLAVDELGIARGGVRTPWVDAPTGILSGLGQPGNLTDLFGTTRALGEAALAERYPHGREDFERQFRDAIRDAVDAGFLLAADAPEIERLGALSWPLERHRP